MRDKFVRNSQEHLKHPNSLRRLAGKWITLGVVGATLSLAAATSPANAQSVFSSFPQSATAQGTVDPTNAYTVVRGDTLYGISKRFNLTIPDILAANGLTQPNQLVAGQKLRLTRPGATSSSFASALPSLTGGQLPPIPSATPLGQSSLARGPSPLTPSLPPLPPVTGGSARGFDPYAATGQPSGLTGGSALSGPSSSLAAPPPPSRGFDPYAATGQPAGNRSFGSPQVAPPQVIAPTAFAAPRPSTGTTSRYTVVQGDTLYQIARRKDVNLRDVISLNGMSAPYRIYVDQTIVLPASASSSFTSGAISSSTISSSIISSSSSSFASPSYVSPSYSSSPISSVIPAPVSSVAPSTLPTLTGTAAGFGASTLSRDVASLPGSSVPPRPGLKPSPPTSVATVSVRNPIATTPSTSTRLPTVTRRPEPTLPKPVAPKTVTVASAKPASSSGNLLGTSAPARSGRFLWPLRGRILDVFGSKTGGVVNDGIDIAANKGEAVRAAESGTVAYAGSALSSFGNLILVKHADGWVTAYGHNDRLLVGKGDQIQKGQKIAEAGSTGSASSNQLHFEVRKGGRAVDPLKYLGQ